MDKEDKKIRKRTRRWHTKAKNPYFGMKQEWMQEPTIVSQDPQLYRKL